MSKDKYKALTAFVIVHVVIAILALVAIVVIVKTI